VSVTRTCTLVTATKPFIDKENYQLLEKKHCTTPM